MLTGLFDSLLVGFEGIIPLRKWIRAVLKSLEGFKGIKFGPSLKPNPIGRLKFYLKVQTGFEGFGYGFSLMPKTFGRLQFSCKVQLKARDRPFQGRELPSMVSTEWVSLVATESPSPTVVAKSPSSLVSKVWLDALAFMDDEPPESIAGDGLDPLSVHVINECIGNAVDGSRSDRSTSGLGSSKATLLSKVILARQIAMVSTPVSQVVNSVSSMVAIFPTSHQCRD